MRWFGKRKPREPEPRVAASPHSAPAPGERAAPRGRAERLETTHPVFRLKAGMSTEAVIGLLGRDYLSMGSGQLFAVLDDASAAEECWLYSNAPQGHDIEIVFRSGALASAEVKEKNADGAAPLVARIDQAGLAAAEPYRAALGAARL